MSKIRRDNFKLSFHTFKGGFGHLFIFSNSVLNYFIRLPRLSRKEIIALSVYIT